MRGKYPFVPVQRGQQVFTDGPVNRLAQIRDRLLPFPRLMRRHQQVTVGKAGACVAQYRNRGTHRLHDAWRHRAFFFLFRRHGPRLRGIHHVLYVEIQIGHLLIPPGLQAVAPGLRLRFGDGWFRRSVLCTRTFFRRYLSGFGQTDRLSGRADRGVPLSAHLNRRFWRKIHAFTGQ